MKPLSLKIKGRKKETQVFGKPIRKYKTEKVIHISVNRTFCNYMEVHFRPLAREVEDATVRGMIT